LRTPRQSVEITEVVEWRDGEVRRVVDYLAAEEPLEIRVSSSREPGVSLSVTMRTPGHDLELAAGFLLTEGIVDTAEQIVGIRAVTDEATGKSNVVEVEIAGSDYDAETMRRSFFAASSCGICGKASIEAVRRRGLRAPNPGFRVSPQILCSLSEKLRGDQAVFEKTGGLHAAGLFTAQGESLVIREDVGRHNAVDKAIGTQFLAGRALPPDTILVVSGRASFELTQKAAAAGVAMLVSVGAPSSLAVDLAAKSAITLIGFTRESGFNVYTKPERVAGAAAADPPDAPSES